MLARGWQVAARHINYSGTVQYILPPATGIAIADEPEQETFGILFWAPSS